MATYKRLPVTFERGEGAWLWDNNGKRYLDALSGIAVCNLGHAHPAISHALCDQAGTLLHTSNIYGIANQQALGDALTAAAGMDRVFFANSGAEANEAAIKLVRKHSSLRFPPDKREIITFEGSFHGRTLTTVTATAQPKYQEGFEPLPGGFVYCPFNDFDAVAAKVSARTCAILVEPVQGEGGINIAAPGFLKHLRALCDQHDALLVCDEVQSGMGRTGRLFAHEWDEVVPDVATLAKALGGGLPIGAMLVGPKAAEVLALGSHGSTFGGNPVVCAVARVMWRRVQDTALLANVQRQSEVLVARLRQLDQALGCFDEIRARGLLVGAQLRAAHAGKAGAIGEQASRHGVLILQAGPDVLRFLPPLNITDEEMGTALERLETALRAALSG